MKAKVIRTGEIIKVSSRYISDYQEWEYKDAYTGETYTDRQLDFEDTIDWEERRYEVAKSILCASVVSRTKVDMEEIFTATDKFIAELKKQ